MQGLERAANRYGPQITGEGDASDEAAWRAYSDAVHAVRRAWSDIKSALNCKPQTCTFSEILALGNRINEWLRLSELNVQADEGYCLSDASHIGKELQRTAYELEQRLAAYEAQVERDSADEHSYGQSPPEMDAPTQADHWNSLAERQRDCLRALMVAGAIHEGERICTHQIATASDGRRARINGFKQPLSDLVMKKLVKSKRGCDGGYWLSDEGRELVRRNTLDVDVACA